MLLKSVWLLLLFVAAYLFYFCDYHKQIDWDVFGKGFSIVDIIYSGTSGGTLENVKEIDAEQKIFSLSELNKYTNLEDGLYLSILGQVYDVTKGAKHYGPGATYHVFTGRDASLAFITGEFDGKGLTDDISGLSLHQVKALDDWIQFYQKNYIYKGKLKGTYYNDDGSPTEESYKVQQILMQAISKQNEEEQRKRMFPPCNVEWNPEIGTKVWCTKRSGGIERDWVGMPRMLFDAAHSQQYRCACVKLDSAEYVESKGVLKEYDGCDEISTVCHVISKV